MKQSLQLKLGQHLTMTPQLQQAIKLLQLSTLDLQTEIQSTLEANPLLEMQDEFEELTPVLSATQDLGKDGASIEFGEQIQEMPWESQYINNSSHSSAQSQDYFNQVSEKTDSLQEHLLWQLRLRPMSVTDQVIASAIVDAILDDGYLGCELDDIHASLPADLEVEMDEIEAVLHAVQQLDPVGVGARNLQECLFAQLQALPQETPLLQQTKTLVHQHFDLLATRQLPALQKKLKLSEDELQACIHLVQSLNPRPGSQISQSHAEYVIPDVLVRKVKGHWMVDLNPDAIPRLRINNHYAGMIQKTSNTSDNNYLKNQLQEARWFLKSLESRNETLLKVATCIVERQRGFFEYGEEAMKPLVLHDVAEAINMHESTVSRVTTQKFMHTPRGIFELKYFFCSHVNTQAGGECSSIAIRALIKKLIAQENTQKPLSDNKIAQILQEQGINVARRTVAKYREAMNIASSNERKRL